MKNRKCEICGKRFLAEWNERSCPECRGIPKGRIHHAQVFPRKKKAPEGVDKKQCRTCIYRAGDGLGQSGLNCDFQSKAGISKIVAFPGCKMPPECPAYRRRV